MSRIADLIADRLFAGLRGRDLTLATLMAAGTVMTALSSYSHVHNVAAMAHWAGWSQPFLPLSLDLLGFAGTRAWMTADKGSPVRRYGLGCAIAGFGASVAGNLIDGAVLNIPGLVPDPYLMVATFAVPPLVLFALAHLSTLSRVPIPKQAKPRRPAASAHPHPDTPDTTPVATRPDSAANGHAATPAARVDKPRSSNGDSRDRVLAEWNRVTATGRIPTNEELATATQVSVRTVRRHVSHLRADHTRHLAAVR